MRPRPTWRIRKRYGAWRVGMRAMDPRDGYFDIKQFATWIDAIAYITRQYQEVPA